MSCIMCSQCCRKIHFSKQIHQSICYYKKSGKTRKTDIPFIAENWKYLGKASEVGGFLYKLPHKEVPEEMYIYSCNLVTEDNKCSIHDKKPKICSGYPYYGDEKFTGNSPYPYKGCGDEMDFWHIHLRDVLNLVIEKKEEESVECA